MTERENLQVLLITYYWPPSGGSGVQRWLKFVKYLPSYGVNPIVFTPENPAFDIIDDALLKDVSSDTEVLHFPIWEPYRVFKKFKSLFSFGRKPGNGIQSNQEGRIAKWIRGNFFIPDPRIFWVMPSVNFLNEFIRNRNIQIVITTGPPHSIHLIGQKLKSKNPQLKWIADFRDPWTDWGALKEFRISLPVMRIHQYLEKRVLKSADEILTISPFYLKKFQHRTTKPVRLITNGYDDKDLTPFLKAFKNWVEERKFAEQVEIIFTGIVNTELQNLIQQDSLLNKIVRIEKPVSHDQLIERYAESSALLLILTGYQDAEGFLPGKMFEYIATGLPVIGTAPENSDAQSVLIQTGAGFLYRSDDMAGIKIALGKLFSDWKSGAQKTIIPESVRTYERKHITQELAKILLAH